MNGFFSILLSTWNFLKIPMNIYGYTFSFWDLALWSCVCLLLCSFILFASTSNSYGRSSDSKTGNNKGVKK